MRAQIPLGLVPATLTILNLSVATARGQHGAATASRVPLHFEDNRGQRGGEVRFLARTPGYTGKG